MNLEVTRRALLHGGGIALMSYAGGSVRRAVAEAGNAPGTPDLAEWRDHRHVAPVLETPACHTIHSYFNTSPESPDGRWVLFYRSTRPRAQRGDICIVERATGRSRVLASNVIVEDAHRAACQQWISGGRRVVFHDLRGRTWVLAAVEIDSGEEQILAEGRQIAWGQPHADLVPLYGPHWASGEHRDLELLDAGTGDIATVVTVTDVARAYPDWVRREYGGKPLSIFFPILSPNLERVFFKMASPAGGGFRSPAGSIRKGLFCYDRLAGRFAYMHPDWGHPAWHPDGRRMLNLWNRKVVLVDCDTGNVLSNPALPPFPGGHPSMSPDGRLFVTDARMEPFGGARGEWGVVAGNLNSGQYEILHRFDNSQGASSWRESHPHPAFSHDGRRIYFNVSAGEWTRLFVVQCRG